MPYGTLTISTIPIEKGDIENLAVNWDSGSRAYICSLVSKIYGGLPQYSVAIICAIHTVRHAVIGTLRGGCATRSHRDQTINDDAFDPLTKARAAL